MESFSPAYISASADDLNGCPCKKLGCCIPEERLEVFPDAIYPFQQADRFNRAGVQLALEICGKNN